MLQRTDNLEGDMVLFHTSDRIIKVPDLGIGRRNADFGQGFYMSSDDSFAGTWARERTSSDIYVNSYEADFTGLRVKNLERDAEWFDYIFHNRRGAADKFADYDVIIGPIANDTIFETYGIVTSGLLRPEHALQLLLIGPEFVQIAVKTEAAAKSLKWIDAYVLSKEAIELGRKNYNEMSKAFEKEFAAAFDQMDEE